MFDAAVAQDFVPRKPVLASGSAGPPDDLVQWISLNLTVTDPGSVAELLQKSEGRDRDEYALTALRIGMLSLKHAAGQIDADAVRREGEKLLHDMRRALDSSREGIQSSLTASLREYFDPQSGRFQERVERLIKVDGDIEQVLRRQVGNDGSELAKTLAAHIGETSPLMKLLNPGESDGLVSAIRSAIFSVVDEEQKRILGEFSLDNDQGALKRLLAEMTEANGQLKTDLAKEVGSVMSEFSLDKEDSALSRLVKRVEVAEETITKEFSLDEQDSALSRLSVVINGAKQAIDANLTLDNSHSPLSRLKRELEAILSSHQETALKFQSDVQSALEGMRVQRQEAARSTQHGKDFEAVASEFVEREAHKAGDLPEKTGAKTGLITYCKVGDLVIELGADCAAAGEKLVVEAKEDVSYTLAKARAEIETARKNRGASVGLFLFSARTAPDGVDPLVRHGDDVFVVWDAEKIESDIVLRAGLSLAKAMCVRAHKQKDAEDGSWDEVESAILAVEKEAGRFNTLRTWTETIQSNSGKILEEIRKMAANLEKQVGILRDSVTALRHE